MRKLLFVTALTVLTIFSGTQTALANEEQQIANALIQSLPKPAEVEKVVVSGSYALVKWVGGPTGGMATLINTDNGWQVISQTSRGWPSIETFAQERGMTIEEAEELLDAYDPNWRQW